jgi:hypothetical protein
MKALGIAHISLFFALLPFSRATVPDLVEIPDSLFIGEKQILYEVRRTCDWEFREYETASDHLDDESAAQQTDKEIANVRSLMVKYTSDANAFNRAVAKAGMPLKQ